MPDPERGTRSNAIREFLKTNPTAGTQEIISALHNQGVEVTQSLVHKIKYRKGARKKRGKTRGRTAAASAAGASISRSDAIRDYLRQNPDAAQKEIKAALRKQGLKVSSGLIGSVKFHLKKDRARPPVRAAARKMRSRQRSRAGTSVTVDQLLEVKRVADSLGGAQQLRHALERLEQLR
jgi:arginine repressor